MISPINTRLGTVLGIQITGGSAQDSTVCIRRHNDGRVTAEWNECQLRWHKQLRAQLSTTGGANIGVLLAIRNAVRRHRVYKNSTTGVNIILYPYLEGGQKPAFNPILDWQDYPNDSNNNLLYHSIK